MKRFAKFLPALALLALATPAFAAEGKPVSAIGMFAFAMDILVVIMLVGCSIAGVAIAIDAILRIRETRIAPPETTEHLRSLISSRQFEELMNFTSTDQSYVSQSLNAGLRRAHLGYPAMREAMETAAGDQTAGYFRRIEFLNIIGNTGPLIGLLGTVLGMIYAFDALNAAGGNAKPSELSGGIARALWHTFGGLLVAIPCLLVYGFYRTKVDKITGKAALVSEELLESLRPAEKGGTTPGSSDKPSPKVVKKVAPAAPQPQPNPEA